MCVTIKCNSLDNHVLGFHSCHREGRWREEQGLFPPAKQWRVQLRPRRQYHVEARRERSCP